jgi:DNA-binding response OmpR family regulator
MAEGVALIIEDSLTQAQIVGRMIADSDWAYAVARTLEEAEAQLVRQRPQLVFVDVHLGGENSLDHLHRIRDLVPNATIAVMTAGSREEAIDETLKAARRANVDYVLRKPFSRRQIHNIVDTAERDMTEGRRRLHALIIDDSPTVVTLTAQTLRDNGFRISTAESMEDAMANVDIAHVDLVVSDIFMPGMGGLEGIKIIKANWPNVKVLAMSAGLQARVTPERATSAAVRHGADAEIHKPFKPVELINLTIELMAS